MLKVLKPGFFSTIQDNGRYGLLDKGVPVSGYMDAFSASKLNKLLENEKDSAMIEVTMTGPQLKFTQPTTICIGGATVSGTINNAPILNYKLYTINSGDIVSFGKLSKGFRAYIAIKGGFQTKKVLNSRSFFQPITQFGCIKKDDEIEYKGISSFKPKISELKIDSHLDKKILKVFRGPEFDLLNDKQLEEIFFQKFSVSKENNRMAYQIKETIPGLNYSMLTSATQPGTIQLTPAGKLIILMKDGQTTGGYPRVLQLSENAISILAQKKYGDKISFKLE